MRHMLNQNKKNTGMEWGGHKYRAEKESESKGIYKTTEGRNLVIQPP